MLCAPVLIILFLLFALLDTPPATNALRDCGADQEVSRAPFPSGAWSHGNQSPATASRGLAEPCRITIVIIMIIIIIMIILVYIYIYIYIYTYVYTAADLKQLRGIRSTSIEGALYGPLRPACFLKISLCQSSFVKTIKSRGLKNSQASQKQ